MSYLHIENLYRSQDIFLFKECYASEKIHGSSSHLSFKKGRTPIVHFFAGGESYDNFVKLFDIPSLEAHFQEMGVDELIIFGEVFGGKCQGMSATYGKQMRFVAFEVKIGENWLNVPTADKVARDFGLDFVPYKLIPTTLEAIDAERLKPSEQAVKNGITDMPHKREGVVLRPPIEVRKNNGDRIICKHKNEDFQERKNQPAVTDPEKLKVLEEANEIADEWCTEIRLQHVLDKLPSDIGMDGMGDIMKAMIEDIEREGKGEIVESKEARKAIGKRTVELFKARLKAKLSSN